MAKSEYEEFVRTRITELRVAKDVSEHRMSLELGKSGSYIRAITNGVALPSLRELFNIMEYLEITPVEFFSTIGNDGSRRCRLSENIRSLDEETLEKLEQFLRWIS